MSARAAIGVVCALVGCGRFSFDPVADGKLDDGGPVARYLLDDDPTDGVEDATRHGHTGTCAPCPTRVAAIDDQGYLFAAGDVIRVPATPELESLTLSAAAWVRPDGPGMCIFGKLLGGATANSWQLCVSPVRELLACVGDVACARFSGAFVDGAWRHVTLTYDGTTVRAWLGGERVIEAPVETRFDGSDILIGGDIDNGVPFALFRGVIDDVRIWDRALTADEVAELVIP